MRTRCDISLLILNACMFSGLLPCLALACIAQGVGGMAAKPSINRSKSTQLHSTLPRLYSTLLLPLLLPYPSWATWAIEVPRLKCRISDSAKKKSKGDVQTIYMPTYTPTPRRSKNSAHGTCAPGGLALLLVLVVPNVSRVQGLCCCSCCSCRVMWVLEEFLLTSFFLLSSDEYIYWSYRFWY